jgi:two-component system, NtrC family, sensor kinase
MSTETEWALRERVKELECLYELARVLQAPEAGLEEILASVAAILPRGFQYPELAGARVSVGGLSRRTPAFTEGPFVLREAIGGANGGGAVEGSVEVSYPREIAGRDPSPFLAEEGMLLRKVAGEVSLAAGRLRAAGENLQLETRLRHADRLATIGVLAAGIAHELNEPLVMILGFAQLVQKQAGLPETAGRDLARIVDAALHARDIVRTLLAFGRGAPGTKEACDLAAIAAGVMDFLEPRCRSEGIEVVRRFGAGAHVRADPTELRQVLVNLAVNAIQATPRGGRMTVSTGREACQAVLSVEDTGVGMSREVMDRIFLPFFTTKSAAAGTGLGLPVVHGIVTSLGGSIAVTSEVGRGARFEVRLPAPGE